MIRGLPFCFKSERRGDDVRKIQKWNKKEFMGTNRWKEGLPLVKCPKRRKNSKNIFCEIVEKTSLNLCTSNKHPWRFYCAKKWIKTEVGKFKLPCEEQDKTSQKHWVKVHKKQKNFPQKWEKWVNESYIFAIRSELMYKMTILERNGMRQACDIGVKIAWGGGERRLTFLIIYDKMYSWFFGLLG